MQTDIQLTDLREKLVNFAVIMRPKRVVDPFYWIGHIPFAFWLVSNLKPATIVELGTHSGNSYCAFLQAVKELKLSTKSYAIDTWEGDAHTTNYSQDVFKEFEAYHNENYSSFSRLIRSTFDAANPHFPNNSIDLLHIDGYHTYESVSHDFYTWLPKMSNSGVVLFHDINVREYDFGVWKLWDELTSTYPSFAFLHSCGLGVLAVGSEVPESIRWLIELKSGAPHHTAFVQNFFNDLSLPLYDRTENNLPLARVAEITKQFENISHQHHVEITKIEQLLLEHGEKIDKLAQKKFPWPQIKKFIHKFK